MSSHLESLINRVKQGLSMVELVHVPHTRWPLPRHLPDITNTLRISVLDSSFNPPTLAHLALANTPPPRRTSISDTTMRPPDFDARLLLLSVRNADKSLKSNDATYAQRLEMMTLLAKEVSPTSMQAETNTAVAIIDEPTFVGKSRKLHEYLQHRLSLFVSEDPSAPTNVKPELTFLVGVDTLERILAVRYYNTEENMRQSLNQFLSSDGDGSRLICARRVTPGSHETPNEHARRVSVQARDYIAEDRVAMVDLGNDVESCSSSEIRHRISRGDSIWRQMTLTAVADYIVKQGLYLPVADDNER